MTDKMIWRLTLGVALMLGGCASSNRMAVEQTDGLTFDPIAFFAGTTEGRGALKIVMKASQPTLVEGHGRVDADGAITLDQSVRRGTMPPTHRSWHLQRVAPGRYAGTLSDAAGPVSGDVAGDRLHLAFAMKGGTRAEQWLYLQPGGQVAHNVMIVRKFGVPVARLTETITRR